MMALAAGMFAAVAAHAATPAEDAAEAARQWAKAVMERDVDTQMKMLPKKMFVKPDSMERERRNRLHEKEMALINGEKWLSFDVQPTGQYGKVGNLVMIVLPYKSVVQVRDGKLQRESSLLAVAEEGSSNWSVIDGSGQNPRSIKIFVPGYAGAPAVPPAVTKLLKE
jgi:hypothetical protein